MSTPTTPYNLDEDVRESFQFKLKDHLYNFRQLTTEEIDQFQNLKGDKEIREWLYQYITPVDEKSPKFKDMAKVMVAGNWKNFIKMVKVEMGLG